MALTLVSITPRRSLIMAGETIQAGVTGSSSSVVPGFSLYINGSRHGAMTYHHTGGNVNYYRCVVPDTLVAGDVVTLRDGATTILYTYTGVDAIASPAISTFEIVRCLADGTESNEGTNLLIKMLKISANVGASGLTVATLQVGNVSVSVANALEDALSATGYTEEGLLASDGLLAGNAFSAGTTFAGLLTIGTDYEQATYSFTVPRDFVNFDLAGAATGGVAIGMFSNATLNNPMFECAYPAYFYGGITGVTNYAAAETPTGGVWLDNKPIYRRVFTHTTTGTGLQSLGTITGLDTVVKIEGVCKSSSNWLPITYAFTSSGGSVTQARAYVSLAGEVSASFSGSGSKTFIVVVYYTKT